MKFIDRFCYKYKRFGIKNLMRYVIGLNALVFVLSLMPNGDVIYQGLLFDRAAIFSGEIWRVVTCLFIPPSTNILFLFFALYFYYIIGRAIEAEWGSMKLTVYYVLSCLLTLTVCFVFDVSLTATYVNLSLFMAFATFYPDFQMLLFFVIPIKIKYLAMVDAGFFLWNIVTTPFPYNLAPVVAMGAYLAFFYEYYVRFFKTRGRVRKSASSYRQNVRETRQAQTGYVHKCAVCGKTDRDDPSEEFRYCSVCTDYACYCSKHIFNHEHHK